MTTLYTFIHWGYLGPSRHPPSLLPILQDQLDSPEFWNHVQVAPNFSSIYIHDDYHDVCEKENPIPLWYNELGLLMGFWTAPNMLCWSGSSCKASGVFVGRNERLGIWNIWEKSSYLSCSGCIGFFYHSVNWAGLALEAKTFHTGDLFQKAVVVLGLVWSTLWKVKDTFHMAFLQVIDRSFSYQAHAVFWQWLLSLLLVLCTDSVLAPASFLPPRRHSVE